jgi:hypothetical protein
VPTWPLTARDIACNMERVELDDFIDAEIVDSGRKLVGILACYWETSTGNLFLGIELTDEDQIRVVPAHGAKLDHAHLWVQLPFDKSSVRSAPLFDCEGELPSRIEQAVHDHFASFMSS